MFTDSDEDDDDVTYDDSSDSDNEIGSASVDDSSDDEGLFDLSTLASRKRRVSTPRPSLTEISEILSTLHLEFVEMAAEVDAEASDRKDTEAAEEAS